MVSDELFVHFFPRLGQKMSDRRPRGRHTWYVCDICSRAFPRWMTDSNSWRESGFVGNVCKHCYEEKVPHPQYLTLDDYLAGREHYCSYYGTKATLVDTWDKPEEDIPPERTDAELEAMLFRGECTIAYANSPKDVMSMCLLCVNEGCPGPYDEDNWEKYLPGAVIKKVPKRSRHLHRDKKPEGNKTIRQYRTDVIELLKNVKEANADGDYILVSMKDRTRAKTLLKKFK